MVKKVIYGIVVMVVLLAFTIAPVAAKGNAQFVNLVEKDGSWNPVVDGAFGKMMYKYEPNLMFVFNAHGVTPSTAYTLINYNDNGWGCAEKILGNGISNEYGDIQIKGGFSASNLVYTYYSSGEYGNITGAKIWLVPTSTMSGDQLNVWLSESFLFETNLIPL